MAITKVSPDLLDLDSGLTITTSDNSDTLSLVSTDTDANAAPYLNFYRNPGEAGADSDQLGQITFVGKNDAGTPEDVDYARIITQIKDASNGTEDGRLAINTMVGGELYSRMNVLEGETVFNDESIDVDFRVESNGNANMLFVDGGNDCVSIGASTDLSGALNITHGNEYGLVTSGGYNFQAKFESTDAEAGIVIEDSNSGTDYNRIGVITNDMAFTTNNSERMRINSDGTLLIGKTSTAVDSSNGVHIKSDGTIFSNITSSTTGYQLRHDYNNRFFVTHLGVINAQTTSISAISDERLKENIKDLETGLDEVLALKPRRFDWVEDEKVPTKNIAGFIAQEVETVLPDLIGSYEHNKIDNAKSLRMGDMIPTLVKAIQEQQTIIDDLKSRIKVLEG